MHLRHLVISSLAALAVGGTGAAVSAADAASETDTGQILTLESTDKPLETVLQWISRRAGVNIVCNGTDLPRVTIRLANVSWQEAVDQIASRYDFVIIKQSDRLWELTKPPKVRMQFEDARLAVVLSAIANQAGVNIVISDDVQADRRLTMTLNGVPWEAALDVIVKATGYAWVKQQYNIVRVVSRDKLQKDLSTRIFRLNYQDAKGLKTVLKELGGGTGNDAADLKVVVDDRSNSLVVTATPPALEAIAATIKDLDARTREVQIEMRFVDFSNSDLQRLGFDPLSMGFNLKGIGQLTPSFTPFNDSFGGGLNYLTRPNGTDVPSSSGGFSANFAYEALSTLSSTELLQAPQMLTLDNLPAILDIGNEIRYAETTVSQGSSIGTIQSTLKEAQGSPVHDGIHIEVTPHITSDGFVSLKLKAKNDKATLILYTNGKPTTDAYYSAIQLPNRATTLVDNTFMVADSKTAVIGGILSNQSVEESRQIPVLGNIPVLGWFFKKTNDSVQQRNLTIFITPHIIPTSEDRGEYEQEKLRMRERHSGLNLKPVQNQETGKSTGPE